MITIEIDNTHVKTQSGTSTKGKPYTIRKQKCIVHGCGRFPKESEVLVPEDREYYSIGHYEVHDLVTVGRYGFEVNRDYYLSPVASKTPAKAAA